MAVLDIGLIIPDLHVPRWQPCSAVDGYRSGKPKCGATPTELYHKSCKVPSHGMDVYLCPIHATLTACGGGICFLCAERGGLSRIRIYRINSEPLRLTGIGGHISAR
jgi:hypothetical protein